jgi:hypothetical protein
LAQAVAEGLECATREQAVLMVSFRAHAHRHWKPDSEERQSSRLTKKEGDPDHS